LRPRPFAAKEPAGGFHRLRPASTRETFMQITSAHITPLVALIAGILILIVPRLLNYVVAIYLIVIGLVGLNGIYHFVH
jgi:cobalamin synthase